jgi:hypothetical protein
MGARMIGIRSTYADRRNRWRSRLVQGRMRLYQATAIPVLLFLITGCAPSPAACAPTYVPAGVMFKLNGLDDTAQATEIRACMDDHCVTLDPSPSPSPHPPFVTAGGDAADSERTVTAKLTLTEPTTHAVLFNASTPVTLKKSNIPHCGGDTYGAVVRVVDRTLVPGTG